MSPNTRERLALRNACAMPGQPPLRWVFVTRFVTRSRLYALEQDGTEVPNHA